MNVRQLRSLIRSVILEDRMSVFHAEPRFSSRGYDPIVGVGLKHTYNELFDKKIEEIVEEYVRSAMELYDTQAGPLGRSLAEKKVKNLAAALRQDLQAAVKKNTDALSGVIA